MSAILTRLALLSVAVLLIAFPALAQTPTDVAPFRPLSRDEFRAQVYRQLDALAGRSTGRVIYTGVTIISPDAPNPRHNMAIIVAGDRIEAVTQMSDLDAKAREGAETYDAAGLYAIPGLIDSHVHNATTPNRPNAEQHLRREIYSGVTAVRDMAGDVRALADRRYIDPTGGGRGERDWRNRHQDLRQPARSADQGDHRRGKAPGHAGLEPCPGVSRIPARPAGVNFRFAYLHDRGLGAQSRQAELQPL